MKKYHTFGMGAVVATAALSLFAMTASAQQPPATAPGSPVVAPVKPAAPAIAKPAVQAPAAKPATAIAKKPAAPASTCKGLDETACKAKPECGFITPTKADAKTGKVDAPYCRKVAGVAVKKKPAAAATPATPASPATAATAPKAAAKPAPAAPAAVKPTAPGTTTKQ